MRTLSAVLNVFFFFFGVTEFVVDADKIFLLSGKCISVFLII